MGSWGPETATMGIIRLSHIMSGKATERRWGLSFPTCRKVMVVVSVKCGFIYVNCLKQCLAWRSIDKQALKGGGRGAPICTISLA